MNAGLAKAYDGLRRSVIVAEIVDLKAIKPQIRQELYTTPTGSRAQLPVSKLQPLLRVEIILNTKTLKRFNKHYFKALLFSPIRSA